MYRVASVVAFVLVVVVCGACRAKQEYSCAVRLNTSAGTVPLAQNTTGEWYSSDLGSTFGGYETTAKRAQDQCAEMVRGRLTAALAQQYPEGVVACTCMAVEGY